MFGAGHYLGGPTSLTLHRGTNIEIYILGDQHIANETDPAQECKRIEKTTKQQQKKKKVYSVDEWVIELLKSQDPTTHITVLLEIDDTLLSGKLALDNTYIAIVGQKVHDYKEKVGAGRQKMMEIKHVDVRSAFAERCLLAENKPQKKSRYERLAQVLLINDFLQHVYNAHDEILVNQAQKMQQRRFWDFVDAHKLNVLCQGKTTVPDISAYYTNVMDEHVLSLLSASKRSAKKQKTLVILFVGERHAKTFRHYLSESAHLTSVLTAEDPGHKCVRLM